MAIPPEPAAGAVRPVEQEAALRDTPARLAACLLAAGWLLIPALQFYATFQRTGLQTEGTASIPALADLDISAGYIALLAATAVYVIVRWAVRGRSDEGRGDITTGQAAPGAQGAEETGSW